MDSQTSRPTRKPVFGILSLIGVPFAALALAVTAENRNTEFGALTSIGICWIALFGSFVCGIIGLVRKERPLWPAVLGLAISAVPGVLFLFGLVESILYHGNVP